MVYMKNTQKTRGVIMINKFPSKEVMEAIYKKIASGYKELAKLPIEEKIKHLVNMQRAYNDFNKKKEKKWRVWEI
jgi:hypothetical protein